MPRTYVRTHHLAQRLDAEWSSVRLDAALAAGTYPHPDRVEVLVRRCADEPDFYVRDMLTWALTRHPETLTVPRLVRELHAESSRARAQALHTLSKIGDPAAWSAITRELLHDPDDDVARAAWRAAVALVPLESVTALTRDLAAQFGRGDLEVMRSLSRALVALGEFERDAVAGLVDEARRHLDPEVRSHAVATEVLLDDPEAAFAPDVHAARRVTALGPFAPELAGHAAGSGTPRDEEA